MATLLRLQDASTFELLRAIQAAIVEHQSHPMSTTKAGEFITNVEKSVNTLLQSEQVPLPLLQNHQIRDLQEQLQEAQQNVTIAEGVATELRCQLTQARSIQATLAATAALPADSPSLYSSARMPDPDRYDGNRESLRNFLLQIRLKVATLSDDQSKLRYTISLLKGPALDQVAAFVRNDRIDLANFESLVQILETAFGDPDRKATAETKLLSLRQANRDFSTYFAEFQRYASEVEWNNAAKLARLRNGLSQELLTDLITITEPEDFTEFAALCQRLDNKRRALSVSRKTLPPPKPITTTRSTGSIGPNSSTPAPTTSTATGTHSGPMDLSAGRRRLSPEERGRRLAEGRCLYCGGLGHMAKDCTVAKRPLRAAAVSSSAPADVPTLPSQSEN